MTYAMKMQEERKEGIKEGIKKGQAAMKHDLVVKMLRDREPLEKIISYTELTEEQIRKVALENGMEVRK